MKYLLFIFSVLFLFSCEKPSTTPVLNDTGITWGGNYPKDINDTCKAKFNLEQLADGELSEGDLLRYQDCNQGADAKNKNRPAFSYQKIDKTGSSLVANAPHWSCVRDKVSGLLWEVKEEGDGNYANHGLHDADDLFTWYNAQPKMNGGAVGDWNARSEQCAGYVRNQPATYCNIEEFVSRINKQGLCGYTNWRVPNRSELETLIHFGRSMPAIDTDFFPNTKNNFYWSYTPVVNQPGMAWGVSFQFGFTAQLKRDNSRSLRLVTDWE